MPGLRRTSDPRGHAAHHDLERQHRATSHEHLVVVVVLAAREIVRREPGEIEQAEHARGRLCGDAALARDLVAARAVAGRDRVERLHDENVRLSRLLVENLRLAARDFEAFVHGVVSASVRGRGKRREFSDACRERTRALRRVADVVRGIEQRANLRGIE